MSWIVHAKTHLHSDLGCPGLGPECSLVSRGDGAIRHLSNVPCPCFPWLFGLPWLILSQGFPWLFFRECLRWRNWGDRESPKRRFSQKTADFRRFTPSPGNSSIWRARETAENRMQIFAENRRFSQKSRNPQIGLCHLRSVTLSSALILAVSLVFQNFRGFGREENSLVNLGALLNTAGQQRKGSTGKIDPKSLLCFSGVACFFPLRNYLVGA